MLGVEHVVHRGQRDVLVDAPVAGHDVPVEQLVVVVGRGEYVIDAVDRTVAVRGQGAPVAD